MAEAVIVSAVRTPIGRANKGVLKDVRADDLASVAVRGALERVPQLDYSIIEDLIFGCAFPEGEQGMNVARLIVALSGLPETVAGTTVNRFCASSLQAFNMAAQNIMLGFGDAFIAGGIENMSRVPMGGFNPSFNPRLVKPDDKGDISPASPAVEEYGYSSYMPMGITAENLARDHHISREEQDAFAVRSHERAAKAWKDGLFDDEVVGVSLPQRKGDPIEFKFDEGIRGDTTAESLGKLRPAFRKDGTITAGSSSQISDGACAVVVMSKAKAEELGLSWLAEIGPHGVVAGPDSSLQEQPARAIAKACEREGITPSDLDLVEINEAFAAVGIVSARQLGIDEDKVNVNGGALAVGHPIGMSGARITLHLALELARRGGGVGAAALCGGGGQGDALILRVPAQA